MAANEEHDAAFAFLKQFYTDRAVDFFDGYLPFGRADEFMDELLQTPPALLNSEDGRRTGLIDPLGTAENIIRMRTAVATEWKAAMQEVPDAHMHIRQAILSQQAQSSSVGGGEVAGEDLGSFQ